ncbi:alpha-N-methyltransferase NTM1 [Delphinella strobiligena]|nr:alpha-N-methyltransferase NTM1 [Delphinella strobiligena]
MSAPDSQIDHKAAVDYWTSTDASVNGMLGGYPQVSRIDLQQSANFIAKLRRSSKTHPTSQRLKRVVDCGAGIGRISLGFLSKISDVVDIVEPVEKFTREISEGDSFREIRANGGVGKIWNLGLEAWHPDPDEYRYDIIWIQWCIGQCTDAQVHDLLSRIQSCVVKGGWIVVKENLSNHPDDVDVYDGTDSSVTRTDSKLRKLFTEAKLKLVSTELQRGFPKDLYGVRIYALQPTG